MRTTDPRRRGRRPRARAHRHRDRRAGHGEHGDQEREGDPAPRATRLFQRERAARVVDELAAGRIAVSRLLGQRSGDHRVELGRQLADPLAGPRRGLLEVREHDRDVRVADERNLAGEALEQQASERVDVRPCIDRVAAHLLGRDVGECPEQALRDVERLHIARGRRDAEVGEVAVLALLLRVDQHVARLDVAMHETARVRGIESGGHLSDQGDRTCGLKATVAPERGAQVTALDQAHRDVDVPVRLAGRVDRNHVRVIEARGQLRLAQDAIARCLVVNEPGREHLQRDGARQVAVDRAEDLAHPTAPDQALEGVPGELVACGEVGFGRHGCV